MLYPRLRDLRKPTAAAVGLSLLLTPQRSVFADVDPHVQEDTFAAEVAALLPPAMPMLAAVPTPGERITLGDWSAVIPWTPHIPVSAAVLPDGRLLTFASNQRTTFPSGPEFTYAATWNPATGQFVEYNHGSHDMFCGALVTLPDGRVLVNGGRATTVRSSIFDWRANTWTRTPDMNDPRWYNTSVALPNGRVWTVSGSGGSGTAERWDELSGYSRLTGINWNPILNEPGYINIWHPFLLLAPDGRLFHFGPTDTMHWVSPDGSGSVANAGTVVPGTHYPKEGSWVMYDEGKIVVAGGGANTVNNASDTTTGTSSPLAYTVDLTGPTPVVTPTASMTYARQFANGVVLPNGEVMVMGGNTSGLKFNDTGSILTPEIWNPVTKQWRTVADMSVPRNYHSLALLLPDGRVYSGGGGLSGNAADHRDAQIYTPAPLFNPDGTLAARPVLSTSPQVIGAGTRFTVTGTPGLTKFSFIRMSAITHSVNTDLRYLTLPFTEVSPGTYELTARANLNVMTPGYWMLFGLNAAGVHSVSKTILVDPTASVQITLAGNQSSYIGQSVSLQMTGIGPAGAVFQWSATGLPAGLTMDATTGRISGVPTAAGSAVVQVSLTDGLTTNTISLTWVVQPSSYSQTYSTFTGAAGLTLNGNAALAGAALRLTPNALNQAGSAFLSNPIVLGPDTSFSTRWVFRIHGTADGADGMTFVIQGNSPNALGGTGSGLGYSGVARSFAVEMDNYQGVGDVNGNHLGVLRSGNVETHLATWTPGWDLENEGSHTVWVDYDGPADQLRVFAAQGVVVTKPTTPVMTVSLDLSAEVGSQGWIGFTAGTGGLGNNQDVEAWSVHVNAFSLPSAPVITSVGTQLGALGLNVNLQMQAADANGDLLTWSSTGLPPGLSIAPASGLISGSPTVAGSFTSTVTVSDGNLPAVSSVVQWVINDVLSLQPLSGSPVLSGTAVGLSATASGGRNPRFRWSFGDGTPDTAFSSSPAVTHTFAAPGRFLVTVTAQDDTGRELTASYRQGVHAPLATGKPSQSSSVLYATVGTGAPRLWVVNPDQDTVSVFDAVSRAKLSEVGVGVSPKTLSQSPDGRVWVANAGSASVTVLRPDFTVAQTIALPRGSRPFGILADPSGTAVYVALEATGNLLKLNSTTGAVLGSLALGVDIRHLALSPDGTRLLVSRFVTPRLPGEDTAVVETTVGGVKQGGEVLLVNVAAFTVAGKTVLEHSEAPDTSNSAKGIPNYLGAVAVSPDGLSAWVPSKQDNIKRGQLRNGGDLTHDMSVRSIASRILLASGVEDIEGRVDFDNAGIASAAVLDPKGLFVFTALEGSREVAVIDAWAKREIVRFSVGRAPQGVAVSPDGRTLFVQNFMDRTVSVFDLTALQGGSEAAPALLATLNTVGIDKLSPTVLLGKQHFYDARDTRLAFQQYVSCASCHNDGGQDGRVWDFTQFGEGLRNTITLRGHGGTSQGPLHWTGNFDEVQDFEGQIRAFAGGTGLMSDADFHSGTRSQPLGDPKAGRSADLDALASYLASLTSNGDSPDRNPDGSLTAAAVAGQAVFQQLNCAQCHSGSQYTDSALGVFHNIGTIRSTSGQRLSAVLTGFDTPTLRGLWATAPYLHDGSALTLEQSILSHSGVSLNATDLANLVAFLRQLDDGGTLAPITGTASTTPASCGSSIGTLTVSVSGGSGVYEYSRNGTQWQSSPVFSGLAAGSYSIQVRNSNGSGTVTLGSFAVSDVCPNLTVADLAVREDAGGASVQVTLSQASPFEARVNYSVAAGTAIVGEDFALVTGTLVFPPATTIQSIRIPLWEDNWVESSKTILVTLTTPQGARITDGSAVVTIQDNDAAPNRTGFRAQYYAGRNFERAVVERKDTAINFDWLTASPAAGVPADDFSVRWTGSVIPAYTETYTFAVSADDGVRLWVNDRQVINRWTASSNTTNTVAVALTAGTPVKICLEYYEATGFASCQLRWSSARTTRQIIGGASPTGLRGRYFSGKTFTTQLMERVDQTVNFNWGTGTPSNAVPANNFSVRWTGSVLPAYTETYTFYTTADDGVRLWVNNQQIINRWTDSSAVENRGTIALTAGVPATIRLEFYEAGGNARCELRWSSARTTKQIIPATALFQPGMILDRAPTLTVPGPQQHTVGQSVALAIPCADLDEQPVVLSASGLPPGLTADSVGKRIVGVPTAAGSYIVSLQLWDGLFTTRADVPWTILSAPATLAGPNSAGVLLTLETASPGMFRLVVDRPLDGGLGVILESSTDLVNWEEAPPALFLGRVVETLGDRERWTFAEQPLGQHGFWRARLVEASAEPSR
ncbi:MAG: DUF1929 domain-containing protein [Verrucomicrobiales bacterium]|nr:DUF1929 domain-containing protein [Verrucomicrobiales bacterium]